MRYVLALTFAASFALSVILVALLRRAALRFGLVDRPGGRKQHAGPMPLGGGIAILLAASLPLLAGGLACHLWSRNALPVELPSGLRCTAAIAAGRFALLGWVLAGGLAFGALGLWDDLRPLRPKAKLLAQYAIALAVSALPQVRVTLFIHAGWVQMLLTATWLVLMVNSFNLLDNMDGQSGLVAFLTGAALLVLTLQTGQYLVAAFLLGLLGAVLGFLVFNLPPASIFMGDTGSMFIGYMLAVATTLATFLTPTQMNPVFPVLVPLVIFAVPLYDVASVLVIRLHKGQPLLAGDRSHFSHRLLRLGMSDRTVLLTVALTIVATAPGATIPYGSSTWRVVVPAIQALAVVLVIVQLELVAARRNGEAGPA